MSVLEKLGIAGFRSYSPEDMQYVTFFKPLTLICGENGSGKTTIIECLRMITAGKAPPNTNSGKTFVTDPLLTGRNQSIGTVKLQFAGLKGRKFVVSKTVQLAKITKKGVTKIEYKSIEQSIKTRDPTTSELISINQHCADVEKQVPTLFGVTPAVLDYVIFCHQEESLWPFSNSDTLKNLFDQLFNTTKFTNSYEAMKEQAKQINKDIKELQVRLAGLDAMRMRVITQNKEKLLRMYNAAKLCERLPALRSKLKEFESGQQSESMLQTKLMKLVGEQTLLTKEAGDTEAQLRETRQLTEQLLKLSTEELRYKYNTASQQSRELNQAVGDAQAELETATESYLNERSKQSKSQKVSLIDLEVRRIRQLLPTVNIQETEHSCNRMIRRLEDESKKYVTVQRKIQQIMEQIDRIGPVDYTSPDSTISYISELNQEREALKAGQLQLQKQLKQMFKDLYEPMNLQKIPSTSQNSASEIVKKGAILEDRKKQLENFKKELSARQSASGQKKKQSRADLIKKRDQAIFFGGEMQNQLIEFSRKTLKCHFCQRSMTQSDLVHVQQLCEQRKKKSEGIVQKFERQIKDAPDEQHMQTLRDNCVMLEKEIMRMDEELSKLKERQNTYLSYQDYCVRVEFMQNLTRLIEPCRIQFDKNGSPKPMDALEKQKSFQLFQDALGQFVANDNELVRTERQYTRISRTLEEEKRKAAEAKANKAAKQKLQSQLSTLREELQSKPLLDVCLGNLRQIEVAGSERTFVDVEEVSRVPQPTEKSNAATRSLYKKFIQARDNYEKVRVDYQKLASMRDIYGMHLKLREVRTQLTNRMTERTAVQQLINQQRLKYGSVKEEFTKIHTIASDPELTRRLNTGNFNQEYWKCFCELEAKKSTQEELTQSMIALDRALHGFHTDKMEEINRLLKETWQEIYHGKDIRNIQIRTNEESTSKKKTYNYNVAMVLEDGNEIEMRGRCSMGQKVLASVVIRLVLAEFFESRCSILALDEPTTNLDTEHIQMLGQQLAKLVASRSGRENFQLIVISHDHQFIKQLKDFTSQYYQVRRDSKFSKISVQNIERLK